jgi:hypothetical protein
MAAIEGCSCIPWTRNALIIRSTWHVGRVTILVLTMPADRLLAVDSFRASA